MEHWFSAGCSDSNQLLGNASKKAAENDSSTRAPATHKGDVCLEFPVPGHCGYLENGLADGKSFSISVSPTVEHTHCYRYLETAPTDGISLISSC